MTLLLIKKVHTKGMTLIEVIIYVALFSVLLLIVMQFIINIYFDSIELQYQIQYAQK